MQEKGSSAFFSRCLTVCSALSRLSIAGRVYSEECYLCDELVSVGQCSCNCDIVMK